MQVHASRFHEEVFCSFSGTPRNVSPRKMGDLDFMQIKGISLLMLCQPGGGGSLDFANVC